MGGASPHMLLMGGVAFVWERERISNEDIVRCEKLMVIFRHFATHIMLTMCACMCTGTCTPVHLRVIILCILYPRVCRCLRGYEERIRQFPVGGPTPSTTATPASTELGTTPPNVNTSTADTVPVDTAVNNPSDDTTWPSCCGKNFNV